MTAPLAKSSVAAIRADIAAALASVTMKHGVTFSLGTIRFNADTMGVKLTGVRLGAAGTNANTAVSPHLVAFKKTGVRILGGNITESDTFESRSLGKVQFVGYNSRAHRYPFIVKQLSTGKQYKISTDNAQATSARPVIAYAV